MHVFNCTLLFLCLSHFVFVFDVIVEERLICSDLSVGLTTCFFLLMAQSNTYKIDKISSLSFTPNNLFTNCYYGKCAFAGARQ